MALELMLDERRLPAMARTLRRGGLLRPCGCGGCAACSQSAGRLLRGLARAASPLGYYGRPRFGERYRVYRRPLGPRTVHLLADTAAGPAPQVVDVGIAPGPDLGWDSPPNMPSDLSPDAVADDGGSGEFFWAGRRADLEQEFDKSNASDVVTQLNGAVTTASLSALAQSARTWLASATFAPAWQRIGTLKDAFANTAIRNQAGLYFLIWNASPTNPRQVASGTARTWKYLGMAGEQPIVKRLYAHKHARLQGIADTQVDVYAWFLGAPFLHPVRALEQGYLKAFLAAAQTGQGLSPAQRFRAIGFDNVQTEMEF